MEGSLARETPRTHETSSDRASPELRRLLRDDETLHWSGTPEPRAWFFGALVGSALLVTLLVASFGGIWALATVADGIVTPVQAATILGKAWLGLTTFVAVLIVGQLRHLEYAVTDERVIKFSGIVGKDASIVDLEDVTDVEAAAGFSTKLLGVGGVDLQVPGSDDSGLTMGGIEDHRTVRGLIEDAREDATAGRPEPA